MEKDPGSYRFGPFTFDVVTSELRRGGEIVHLPRQPSTLLALLLRNAGKLVTRAEIQRTCWPETVHGVDPVINAAVRQIRRALSDSVSRPRFVETLPRFLGRPGRRRSRADSPGVQRYIDVAERLNLAPGPDFLQKTSTSAGDAAAPGRATRGPKTPSPCRAG